MRLSSSRENERIRWIEIYGKVEKNKEWRDINEKSKEWQEINAVHSQLEYRALCVITIHIHI